MDASNKIEKDKKIFLLIIIVVFIGIISANFHIVVDTPKTFIRREYIGFEDPIASIDRCTGIPYFVAMSKHQSLCKSLQREGYLESDDQREERVKKEIEQEVEDMWNSTTVESENHREESTEKIESEPTTTESESSVVENEDSVEEPKNEDNVPTAYKSALNKAKTYLDTMDMSKDGLYKQLTSEYGEQFSEEAGQYAIDNINANWKENALKKAQEYERMMHMSKDGLYKQLSSDYGDQFTQEQAQYAIDNINANWKENALKKAQEYQDMMNMSPEAIRDQLSSDYGDQFTQEQADYAIENLK